MTAKTQTKMNSLKAQRKLCEPEPTSRGSPKIERNDQVFLGEDQGPQSLCCISSSISPTPRRACLAAIGCLEEVPMSLSLRRKTSKRESCAARIGESSPTKGGCFPDSPLLHNKSFNRGMKKGEREIQDSVPKQAAEGGTLIKGQGVLGGTKGQKEQWQNNPLSPSVPRGAPSPHDPSAPFAPNCPSLTA